MENLPQKRELSLTAYADNLQTKLQMCQTLMQSGMCPARFKTKEAIFGAIIMGEELGFSPMASLRVINVIQGQASLSAAGMKAKALAMGGQINTTAWDAEKCTVVGIRPGWAKPETVTYTMAEAKQAGLAGKDNWVRMPKAMLYARAVSTLCRNMWADVMEGIYSTEELLDSAGKTFEYDETGNIIEAEVPSKAPPIVKSGEELEAEQAQRAAEQGTDAQSWVYDLDELPTEHQLKAAKFLTKIGATQDQATGWWYSPKEIKNLTQYRVGE